jgi:glycosyltransferase involved in cell wall biosynthesis
MPLPDDEWAKGKCGLKGISYMSCAIPTILSPVGVNSEIIQHGENGFLANTDEDWLNYLSLLIENPDLRKKLGENARKTVEEKYSVEVNKHLYLKAIQEVLK